MGLALVHFQKNWLLSEMGSDFNWCRLQTSWECTLMLQQYMSSSFHFYSYWPQPYCGSQPAIFALQPKSQQNSKILTIVLWVDLRQEKPCHINWEYNGFVLLNGNFLLHELSTQLLQKLLKGRNYSREETIRGNTVFLMEIFGLIKQK